MYVFSSIITSGMQAFRGQMAAAAHNLANERTPGYKRLVARTIERPEGGVDLLISRDQSPGPPLYDEASISDDGVLSGDLPPAGDGSRGLSLEGSNVDPVTEMVDLAQAQRGFEMLAAAYKRHEETMGSLLDAFA